MIIYIRSIYTRCTYALCINFLNVCVNADNAATRECMCITPRKNIRIIRQLSMHCLRYNIVL